MSLENPSLTTIRPKNCSRQLLDLSPTRLRRRDGCTAKIKESKNPDKPIKMSYKKRDMEKQFSLKAVKRQHHRYCEDVEHTPPLFAYLLLMF